MGGLNCERPLLWAALIVGGRGPSAHIRAAQIRANKVIKNNKDSKDERGMLVSLLAKTCLLALTHTVVKTRV